MAEVTSSSATAQARQELILTRILGAPCSLVFRAWTDPQRMARCWGPRGFTNPVCELDVRPGGLIRIDMCGPDGTDYKNRIAYLEVVKPERLVYNYFEEKGDEAEKFQTTVTFRDRGARTEVILRALFPTAAARELVAEKQEALEGGQQTLERLAEVVGSGSVRN
jgi:uncharacterized protein YndB with AHSA1/START domain